MRVPWDHLGVKEHEPFDPERAREGRSLDDRETPYALLARGRELMRGRHFAQAAVVLERAARIEPGRGSILEALGRASYNAGHHARAAEVFAELLDVDPSSHYAHFGLGQSLKQLGRLDEAGTHLRIAVALAPGSRLYAAALRRLQGGDRQPVIVGEPAVDGEERAEAASGDVDAATAAPDPEPEGEEPGD
jgi:tetratricopeptide (TPR) repeat protein